MKLLLLLSLFAIPTQAQYNQQSILSGQSGQNLLNNLVNIYKPNTVLSYNNARDTMFSNIYAIEDSVSCVYTGHKLYLPPTTDPSTALYNNGNSNGINTEHTYPQSKGASSGNAKSDMHHLFPVRASVNSARNNFPYEEIDSLNVTNWYYLGLTETTPSHKSNNYSKLDSYKSVFEPRNSHKGNTARAAFYFYTMYKAEADAADSTFFKEQLNTFCQWHLDDPVDSLEWVRNQIIASYQEGKENPFILDCTLANRTYCPLFINNCALTSTYTPFAPPKVELYPTPVTLNATIQYRLERSASVVITIYNFIGETLKIISIDEQQAGFYKKEINCSNIPNGVYLYSLKLEQEGKSTSLTKKFFILH